MTESLSTIRFADLPALLAPIDGGEFMGILTLPSGQHAAMVSLGIHTANANHQAAKAWAADQGGVLPSRAAFNLLRETLGDKLPENAYWTSGKVGYSGARYCLSGGLQFNDFCSAELGVVAVRRVAPSAPVTGTYKERT